MTTINFKEIENLKDYKQVLIIQSKNQKYLNSIKKISNLYSTISTSYDKNIDLEKSYLILYKSDKQFTQENLIKYFKYLIFFSDKEYIATQHKNIPYIENIEELLERLSNENFIDCKFIKYKDLIDNFKILEKNNQDRLIEEKIEREVERRLKNKDFEDFNIKLKKIMEENSNNKELQSLIKTYVEKSTNLFFTIENDLLIDFLKENGVDFEIDEEKVFRFNNPNVPGYENSCGGIVYIKNDIYKDIIKNNIKNINFNDELDIKIEIGRDYISGLKIYKNKKNLIFNIYDTINYNKYRREYYGNTYKSDKLPEDLEYLFEIIKQKSILTNSNILNLSFSDFSKNKRNNKNVKELNNSLQRLRESTYTYTNNVNSDYLEMFNINLKNSYLEDQIVIEILEHNGKTIFDIINDNKEEKIIAPTKIKDEDTVEIKKPTKKVKEISQKIKLDYEVDKDRDLTTTVHTIIDYLQEDYKKRYKVDEITEKNHHYSLNYNDIGFSYKKVMKFLDDIYMRGNDDFNNYTYKDFMKEFNFGTLDTAKKYLKLYAGLKTKVYTILENQQKALINALKEKGLTTLEIEELKNN